MGFPWDVLYSATLRILRNSLSGRWNGQTRRNMATAFNSVAAVRGTAALLCWAVEITKCTDRLQVVAQTTASCASYSVGHTQLRV